MNHERTNHPHPDDAELGALLRGLADEPPAHEVDWGRLRGSIRRGAELPLARLRGRPEPAVRRARRVPRVLVPLAAAASVALAAWLGARPPEPAGALAAFPSVEEALEADISEQEFRLLVSGRAQADALLLIALD